MKSTKLCQRLPISKLKSFEALQYGIFLHYGLSTFAGHELTNGQVPSSAYAPSSLNVEQWISVARDAGMRYAILTTKHTSGHCLWPSDHTDYHVGTSGDSTDVCQKFSDACRAKGLLPGFYYCSWDNHHLSPGQDPCDNWPDYHPGVHPYTTADYRDFQLRQLEELIKRYRPAFLWIDIPMILPMDYRIELYNRCTEIDPNLYITLNHSLQDGTKFDPNWCWPCDIMTLERVLPAHTGPDLNGGMEQTGYDPVKIIQGRDYYIPGEYCDCIGEHWFYKEGDRARSDEELLGMYLTATSRGVNCLLNVPPDTRGLLPTQWIDALGRLRKNLDLLSVK